MKFRGKLVDIGCIQHFSRIVGTIAKLAKNAVLRITSDKLYFILSEQAINGGVKIWCELPQGHFFDEFAMEGVSVSDANEIYLDLLPDNLVRALKTAQSAKWIKIKLTKKQVPCLTVEVDLPSLSSHDRVVVHDIPVSVIPRRLWDDLEEPELPKFDVSICMPHIKVLRSMVDKMKNLSNYVVLSANQNGEFKLMVETEMVSVATHFRDLTNPTWSRDSEEMRNSESQSQTDRSQDEFAEGRIDIRKFAQFIASQQLTPNRVVCNIENRKTIQFFLLHEDVSLQYFMPVVSV